MSKNIQQKRPGKINVLSIDGGGIRGLIPALFLAEIEKRTHKKIYQLFDIIAGTSTGGILALGLTKPKEPGSTEPAFSIDELVELYETRGDIIFPKSRWRRLSSLGGMLDEKYSATGLEGLLDEYFGDARLSQTLTRVVITSYDIEIREVFFFRSANAKIPTLQDEYDYPMKVVARATSAAPTYFEPAKIDRASEEGYWALIDGGVVANNPAMCAYVEALQLNRQAEICLVSLGTGQLTRRLPYDDARGWGLPQWLQPILDMVFDGASDTVHYQLKKLLRKWDYYRFQVELKDCNDAMDDVTEENLQRLRDLALEMIDDSDDLLERAGDRLLANKYYPLTNKDIANTCEISPNKAASKLRGLNLGSDLFRELRVSHQPEKRYALEVLELINEEKDPS